MPNRWLIWAGSKLVVMAGTLMTFADQSLDIDFWINDDLARVTFAFPRDEGTTRAEYKVNAAAQAANGRTPPTVLLSFFNLPDGYGAFSDGPLRLGTVGGHSVWLVYEVTTAIGSKSVKKISYTLWEGPGSDQSGTALNVGEYRG